MRKFFAAVFIICASFFFGRESPNILDLLESASRKDKAAFATDYLHAAFSAWQDRFRLESFRVDSVFAKGEYDEVWLNRASSNHGLALLVNPPPARKIIEARRLLIAEREKLSPLENELVEFIERFAWIYEAGAESFMQDFLYPSHVKLRYGGSSKQNEILAQLRAKFKDLLPVQSIGWEGRNYTYLIRLVVDSPLMPLEISVDIQKHLTANFFEIADKSERVQALKDSLRLWATPRRSHDAGRSLVITAETSQEAIAKVLSQHFKDYDLARLDSAAKSATIEAALPALDGLRPASVRFRLEASRAGANKYSIFPVWLASRPNADGVAAIDETVQRYSTLDLPLAFQPEFGGIRNIIGSLVLHHRQADSVQWRSAAAFQNILQGLTRDKRAYFFLQGKTKSANNVTVTGYAIWRDTQRLWQHVAKIAETYFPINRKYQLNKVTIDLYPFIRLENVRALFAQPDTSARRERIVITR